MLFVNEFPSLAQDVGFHKVDKSVVELITSRAWERKSRWMSLIFPPLLGGHPVVLNVSYEALLTSSFPWEVIHIKILTWALNINLTFEVI